MQKSIKIFLGSSIVEFERERQDIENFLYRISRDFEKRYNVSIEPLLCENFDDAYTKIRKQEEYNEIVRESDMCVFIFFTKVGQYTHEEFEVARKKFEETGKPKIYTYFKTINDGTVEQSVQDFMTELDSAFQHYYGNFEHIDTVKLRILLNLKLQELEAAEIKVDADNCVVDGKKVLSLKNVSEFANNRILQEFTEELKEVEEKYFTLKAKYETGTYTSNEERQYIEIATRRQTLIDAIEELRKNIFNMSLRMCKDELRGEITLRQKEAYRLFEMGDLEGANSILDFSEIKNEYMRRKAIREAEQKKDAQIFIRESRTKIEILTAMTNLSARFDEIEAIYDEITEIAFEENVELDIVFDFVEFLFDQNKHPKAYEIGKTFESCVSETDYENIVRICNILAEICNDYITKNDESEFYYTRAIEAQEHLLKENPEKHSPALATIYNDVGLFYASQVETEKAIEYLEKGLEIRKQLAEKNAKEFNFDLASSYESIGYFYSIYSSIAGIFGAEKDAPKAIEAYEKAISIYENLAEIDLEKYGTSLARVYDDIGDFYMGLILAKKGQQEISKKYYMKALETRENLVKMNPEKFRASLAKSYVSMAGFYERNHQPDKAETCRLKSVEIRKILAAENPGRFNPSLANTYNNIGDFYERQKEFELAQEYYTLARMLYEKIVETNPDIFTLDIAETYFSLGVLYQKNGVVYKAEEYFDKGKYIFDTLIKENHGEEYYRKALTTYGRLSTVNPEKLTPYLAETYYNFGLFSEDELCVYKAYSLAKQFPQNPICQKIISDLEARETSE